VAEGDDRRTQRQVELRTLRFGFYPDRSSQGGLGLGLFICHELVTAHGGRLEVQSTAGQGTTFTVWLPLLDEGTDTGVRGVRAA